MMDHRKYLAKQDNLQTSQTFLTIPCRPTASCHRLCHLLLPAQHKLHLMIISTRKNNYLQLHLAKGLDPKLDQQQSNQRTSFPTIGHRKRLRVLETEQLIWSTSFFGRELKSQKLLLPCCCIEQWRGMITAAEALASINESYLTSYCAHWLRNQNEDRELPWKSETE